MQALWKLLQYSECGEGGFGDNEILYIVSDYQKLLNEYSNTDISPEIKFEIILFLQEMYEKDEKRIKQECEEFINNYPNDKNFAKVKSMLEQSMN